MPDFQVSKSQSQEGWLAPALLAKLSSNAGSFIVSSQQERLALTAPFSSKLCRLILTIILMARKWSNQNLPGALHFVTGNLLDRIPVFKQDASCRAFLDVCATLMNQWPCKLTAYVVMPDHIHLIVNPRDGHIRGFVGALKSLSAKHIVEVTGDSRFIRERPDADGSMHQVWQESFKGLPLWSGWMIWQKIN